MTLIYTTRTNQGVTLAADMAVNSGDFRQLAQKIIALSRGNSKAKHSWYVAFSGTFVSDAIVHLNTKEMLDALDSGVFKAAQFIYDTLNSKYKKLKDGVGSGIIVNATTGERYVVKADMTAYQILEPFYAIGSGADFAYGFAAASKDLHTLAANGIFHATSQRVTSVSHEFTDIVIKPKDTTCKDTPKSKPNTSRSKPRKSGA